MKEVVYLIAVFFLVLVNGFFVASEFAMVKLRSSRLEALISEGNIKAKYCKSIKKDMNSYLSACQLGITLASLGLGWIGEPALSRLISPLFSYFKLDGAILHTVSFTIAFIIITALHIVLGELVPKSLAIYSTEKVMLNTSIILIVFYKVMYPVIWLFNVSTDIFLKPFGLSQSDEIADPHTDEEIRILIEESYKSGLIDETEQQFVDNIFDFGDKMAREIMIPRTDMACLYKTDSEERVLSTVKEQEFTRYPLCGRDKDEIIGFVHIKDIYRQKLESNEIHIEKIIRKIIRVPETASISKLLEKFKREKLQMAIVMDEYGGTSGLVTIEDILEEIVGEIQDEFDEEITPIKKIDNNTYSITGIVPTSDVGDYFGINIECEDFDSIGGWLYYKFGSAIKESDTIILENYSFTVTKLDKTRVVSVIVKKIEDNEAVEAQE
jgi:Hemolysins and related proteins containing CBS domains